MLGPMTIGALSSGAGAATPLLTDLVSFWELEEASGTRADAHGTNDLADNNGVGQAAGKVGNAALCTTSLIEYLSSTSDDFDTGDISFTWAGWIWFTSMGTNPFFSARYSAGGTEEWRADYWSSPDRLRFEIRSSGGAFKTVNADNFGAPTIETWYFVVFWHDADNDTVNIQVNNGVADSLATTGIFPGIQAVPFTLGTARGTNRWDGRLDQVGYWKRVLTADERTWLYNSGNGRSYAEVASYTGG